MESGSNGSVRRVDAKVIDGHAHRFRDTMAVELLKAGTPIERVSILLGHSSVRVTEKHYNPWNRARVVVGNTKSGGGCPRGRGRRIRSMLLEQKPIL